MSGRGPKSCAKGRNSNKVLGRKQKSVASCGFISAMKYLERTCVLLLRPRRGQCPVEWSLLWKAVTCQGHRLWGDRFLQGTVFHIRGIFHHVTSDAFFVIASCLGEVPLLWRSNREARKDVARPVGFVVDFRGGSRELCCRERVLLKCSQVLVVHPGTVPCSA